MKNTSTPLVDEHLQSLIGMQEADTDDFFYTRLKAKMQKDQSQQGWSLPLKPVWVIGGLTLLLVLNGFILIKQSAAPKKIAASSSVQNFAESYDQIIASSY